MRRRRQEAKQPPLEQELDEQVAQQEQATPEPTRLEKMKSDIDYLKNEAWGKRFSAAAFLGAAALTAMIEGADLAHGTSTTAQDLVCTAMFAVASGFGLSQAMSHHATVRRSAALETAVALHELQTDPAAQQPAVERQAVMPAIADTQKIIG